MKFFSHTALTALEKAATEQIVGASMISTMFKALCSVLGGFSEDTDSSSFTLKDGPLDKEALGIIAAGLASTINLMEGQTTNLRVQLAAMYRDAFLEQAGFDQEVKPQLRSLPPYIRSAHPQTMVAALSDEENVDKSSDHHEHGSARSLDRPR